MLGWFKRKKKKKDSDTPADVLLAAEDITIDKAKEDEIDEQAAVPEPAPEPVSETEPVPEPLPELVPVPEAEIVAEPDEKSLAGRLMDRLAKSRHSLLDRVDALFLGRKTIDQDLLDDLEEILITADIGVQTTLDLLSAATAMLDRNELSDPQSLKKVLQEQMIEYLRQADAADLTMPDSGPFVIMVLGVNGVGKTTTIGKLAHKFTQAGQKVLLVAADTFRAAASEQLQIWGKRIGVEVVAHGEGADPSAVIYDALESANGKKADVIIVDTAGRMHTQVNLVKELKKIKRVMGKKIAGAPHEVMLVLDATTGQNGISQARLFNEAVDVTGLTLTKLDGTARGGIVINICREFKIPIRFIGIGEQMDDLRDFEPESFVDALFGKKV